MPFRKYSRRYSKSGKLSKSNILSNRGAKSQSKQIAALNRKVNILSKVNRPEIRTMYRQYDLTFTNSVFSSNFNYFQINPWNVSYTGDDQASGSLNLEGNFNRSKGVLLKIVSQYADNWRDTIADEAHDPSAGYRVVIFQLKTAQPISESTVHTLEVQDIFNVSNSVSSGDSNLVLPLVQGLSSTYKILYNKTFLINRYHPTRLHNIHIPGKRLLNFSRSVSSTTASVNTKGTIFVAFLTGGLHSDVDYTSQIKLSANFTLYFTDN